MNPLEQFISDSNLDALDSMNHLQNHGIISDCCIWADSVHKDDWAAAIEFLKKSPPPITDNPQ